jgi:DNA-binding response OmpR family regulator
MSIPGEQNERVVVYIEDDVAMLELVTLILKNQGFKVIGVMGGQEGLEVIGRVKPDAVLLDLMMPDMGGWDVYQHMKASEEMKHIPVIIVTAKAQDIDKVLGIRIAKVQDYITKPFSPAELVQRLEKVLKDSPQIPN